MNIKILKTVIANVDGKSVRLEEGEVLNVPDQVGEMLKAGGYAEGTRAAAKVKVQPEGKPLSNRSMKGK